MLRIAVVLSFLFLAISLQLSPEVYHDYWFKMYSPG